MVLRTRYIEIINTGWFDYLWYRVWQLIDYSLEPLEENPGKKPTSVECELLTCPLLFSAKTGLTDGVEPVNRVVTSFFGIIGIDACTVVVVVYRKAQESPVHF